MNRLPRRVNNNSIFPTHKHTHTRITSSNNAEHETERRGAAYLLAIFSRYGVFESYTLQDFLDHRTKKHVMSDRCAKNHAVDDIAGQVRVRRAGLDGRVRQETHADREQRGYKHEAPSATRQAARHDDYMGDL